MALTLNPSKAPLTYLIKSVHAAVQLSLDALDPEALPLLTNMPLEAFSQVGATLESLLLKFLAASCFAYSMSDLHGQICAAGLDVGYVD